MKDDLFFLLECFGIFVLRIEVIKEIFDHDNEEISDIDPVALHLPIARNIFDNLNEEMSTALS